MDTWEHMAAQYGEGIDWCYFTKANEDYRPFQGKITCCASSGPRALEMFSRYLIGEVDRLYIWPLGPGAEDQEVYADERRQA